MGFYHGEIVYDLFLNELLSRLTVKSIVQLMIFVQHFAYSYIYLVQSEYLTSTYGVFHNEEA